MRKLIIGIVLVLVLSFVACKKDQSKTDPNAKDSTATQQVK